MEDGIVELSGSSFINPLTTVYRENKEPHICIDARMVNNVVLPDRARAPPIDEMPSSFTDLNIRRVVIRLKRFYRSHWKQVPGSIPLSYLVLMSINFSAYLRWQLLCEVGRKFLEVTCVHSLPAMWMT